MIDNLSTHSAQTGQIKDADWQTSQASNGYRIQCLQGKLIDSVIWISHRATSNIIFLADVQSNDKLHKSFQKLCSVERWIGNTTDQQYTFDTYGRLRCKYLNNFLVCIDLINEHSPIGKQATSTISKLMLSCTMEANLRFFPAFIFMIAMNNRNFLPIDVTRIICQLFIQNTGI